MKDIDLIYELGTLRNLSRGWQQHLGDQVASITEHSFRVIWIALLISRMEKQGDENLIIKMALTHDLDEIRTSDLGYIQKMYVKANSQQAVSDTFADTLLNDFVDIIENFEKRDSIEAKIVKDADNLDIDFELKEMAERGHQLPKKWYGTRKHVRDYKLYTESAKKIWDELQNSNVSAWHLQKNKYSEMPDAGK